MKARSYFGSLFAAPPPARTAHSTRASVPEVLPPARSAAARRVATATALQPAPPRPPRSPRLRSRPCPPARARPVATPQRDVPDDTRGTEQFPLPRRHCGAATLLGATRTDPSTCQLRSAEADPVPRCPQRACGGGVVIPATLAARVPRIPADLLGRHLPPQARQQLRVATEFGWRAGAGGARGRPFLVGGEKGTSAPFGCAPLQSGRVSSACEPHVAVLSERSVQALWPLSD